MDETTAKQVDWRRLVNHLQWIDEPPFPLTDGTLQVARTLGGVDAPIHYLDLSVRTYNALRRSGVQTIGDLLLLCAAEPQGKALLRVHNIGQVAVNEIYNRLAVRLEIE